MTKEEMIEAIAGVLAGLQVPLSIGMPLGAADEPYRRILEDSGFGWKDASDLKGYLEGVLA